MSENSQGGFSLIEVMVSAAVMAGVGAVVARSSLTVSRAQTDHTQIQMLDRLEQNLRREMFVESSDAILSLFDKLGPDLEGCLTSTRSNGASGNFCISYQKKSVDFISADTISIPPLYKISGEPCPYGDKGTPRDCPWTLTTTMAPLCEWGISTCKSAQGVLIEYKIIPRAGASADAIKLAGRNGAILVRFP